MFWDSEAEPGLEINCRLRLLSYQLAVLLGFV